MDASIAAAIIGPTLTALFGLLAYIAVKVQRHDLADQALKTAVEQVDHELDQALEKLAVA